MQGSLVLPWVRSRRAPGVLPSVLWAAGFYVPVDCLLLKRLQKFPSGVLICRS